MLWVRVQSVEHNVIICAIYHPPKPVYHTVDLLCHIDSSLETISRDLSSAHVVLAGDFNSLSDSDVVSRTGLISLVKKPTRGASCLDRIYVNDLCYENVRVVTPTVKSDHCAIIAYSDDVPRCNINKRRFKRRFRKRTPVQHDRCMSTLCVP